MTAAPPPLDELVGEWMSRADLTHLHSLRNQWGQAHVNGDLTSLSWLAIPPFSGGYHTGALRVNGTVVAAERLRWAPWGVQREGMLGGLRVVGETRLAYEANRVLWQVTVTNEGEVDAAVTLEQELLAPIAHSEVGWGWLYGTPWNSGDYHDFFATERLRAETTSSTPRQIQLLPHTARVLRLGRPRLPGIQRDEDGEEMLLDSALPDHTTSDVPRSQPASVRGVVTNLVLDQPNGNVRHIGGAHTLATADTEIRLEAIELADGSTLSFDLTTDAAQQSGVVLTHGNHPDSLQLGLLDGRPWIAIGGERETATSSLVAGTHQWVVRMTSERAQLLVDGSVVAATKPWWSGQRWESRVVEGVIETRDIRSPARAAYATHPTPSTLTADGSRGLAAWSFGLAPGESAQVSFVLQLGTEAAEVSASARSTAGAFTPEFESIADRWRELWLNAFTPGNPDHSGYLPVFEARDPDLARTYYLGALLALYLRNTGVSDIGPVFLTGGPRLGPTTTFYWDMSEWARTAAMLEPVGMRAWILAALAQPYDSSHSFDTKNMLPVGNHYAANDHALFRVVQHYVGVTGDLAILDESAAGRTVLDHLRTLAFRPRERRINGGGGGGGGGGGTLVDFGHDSWELLECVPNYRDVVVSFNAGYVGMLRSLATLLELRGTFDEAILARQEADKLATAVLGQYAGNGRWRISHPTNDDVIGHCLDFELVAADMAPDLSDHIKDEMVAFVTEHLIDGEWMRALAPDDPIAPFSDRPDHGAAGAFAAWPGSTSFGLTRLGRPDIAAEFLSRLHRSRSGALWGQAVETIGDGHFTVAERGVSNRDSNAAVAVTEAVLAGLFGIQAGFQSLESPAGELENSFGRLSGVRAVGFDLARVPPKRVAVPTDAAR